MTIDQLMLALELIDTGYRRKVVVEPHPLPIYSDDIDVGEVIGVNTETPGVVTIVYTGGNNT